MRTAAFLVTFALFLSLGKAQSHEFWINPLNYQVDDGNIVASLRVGQEFGGVAASYLPRNFVRFDVIVGDAVSPVAGRMGDNPALDISGVPDGLAIIVHETTVNRLTYDEWDRFLGFAEHKDFPDIEARHDARSLPREGFRESYIRYAKSLVAVGNGDGNDRLVGLLTEIVAGANPYTDELDGSMPVQVFHDGVPRAGAQLELFDRAPDGTVTITLYRANETGQATLPVQPGHEYLVDAVTLIEDEASVDDGPVWRSLWASLTFSVPE